MRIIKLLIAGLLTGVFVLLPLAQTSAIANEVVYDAIPSSLPPNVVSLGYEATSTTQFGDKIHLGGTGRSLKSVGVTMSAWGLFSEYSSNPTYSGNSSSWSHPITVNVYSTALGGDGAPTTLLATKTETKTIPWRPAADPTCATPTAWRAGDGQCYNGYAFNLTFDLSSLNVTLPNDIIIGIVYNTSDYGPAPIHQPGPYNSLNVGIPSSQVPTVGSDDNADNVFWNTSHAPFYTDGGAAGVGIFRQDTNWSPNGTVAFRVEVTPQVGPPTSKDQCKHKGWKNFNNPSFKNEDKCIDYVKSHGIPKEVEGTLQMSGPKQKVVFNIDDDHGWWGRWRRGNNDKVEYWNYEHPGGLHYKAKVLCVGGEKFNKEARVMWQIPAGEGSLSGLYVVAYTKEVKHGPDLYGHNATADLATATAWCETGTGFAPTMYPVTKGSVDVE